ncbi:MAG: hypothetical protein WD079_04300, partial [Phycisphaeraceae bacterium]
MIHVRRSHAAIFSLVAVLALGVFSTARVVGEESSQPASYDPLEMYEVRPIRGWDVHINQRLLAEEDLAAEVLELLEHRLADVNRLLPKPALEKLHTVKIWCELEHPTHPNAHYHPNPGWLEANGFLPDKHQGVEFGSARRFLNFIRPQPFVVVHELAHAYHHGFLEDGYQNAEIREAYEAAKASGKYEEV